MAQSTEKVMTPEFRASFVKLAKPDKTAGGEDKYGITMIFDPSVKDTPEFKAMQRICGEAKTLMWGDKPPSYLLTPFRKGAQKTEENQRGFDLVKYPEYEGMIIVSAMSVAVRPDCRDNNVQPILDLNQIYAGCYCRAFVVAFGYEPKPDPITGQKKGNYGITFGLQAVQKLRDGDRLAGGATDAGKDFAPFIAPAGVGSHADMLDDDLDV